MLSSPEKKCFIISPFGKNTVSKKQFNDVRRHLIDDVCEPLGYICERADDIAAPGIITTQIISRLLEYDLVIADLTDTNPNVFYELAIRHMAQKPVILIAKKGTKTPFDVQQDRIIFYDLDLDSLGDAKDTLRKAVREIESDDFLIESPVTVTIDSLPGRTLSSKEKIDEMYFMIYQIKNNQEKKRSFLPEIVEWVGDDSKYDQVIGIASPKSNVHIQLFSDNIGRWGHGFTSNEYGVWVWTISERHKKSVIYPNYIVITDKTTGLKLRRQIPKPK